MSNHAAFEHCATAGGEFFGNDNTGVGVDTLVSVTPYCSTKSSGCHSYVGCPLNTSDVPASH